MEINTEVSKCFDIYCRPKIPKLDHTRSNIFLVLGPNDDYKLLNWIAEHREFGRTETVIWIRYASGFKARNSWICKRERASTCLLFSPGIWIALNKVYYSNDININFLDKNLSSFSWLLRLFITWPKIRCHNENILFYRPFCPPIIIKLL